MSSPCHHSDGSTDETAVVVDFIGARADRLAVLLARELRVAGAARADLEEVGDAGQWRAAARLAARTLGWRVRTGLSGGFAWAVSEDWAPSRGADRRAANVVAAVIFGGLQLEAEAKR